MALSRIIIQSNPDLFDRVIVDIQKGLGQTLPWLNHIFGKAERLSRVNKKGKMFTPNIFLGGNEYLDLSPNADLGSFCFFTIDDPEQIEWMPKITGTLTANYSIVFWIDLRKTPYLQTRNIDQLKGEALKALNGKFLMPNGRLTVTRIYNKAETIYAGFSLDEIDNQFLMHPYAGFRFSGVLTVNESC